MRRRTPRRNSGPTGTLGNMSEKSRLQNLSQMWSPTGGSNTLASIRQRHASAGIPSMIDFGQILQLQRVARRSSDAFVSHKYSAAVAGSNLLLADVDVAPDRTPLFRTAQYRTATYGMPLRNSPPLRVSIVCNNRAAPARGLLMCYGSRSSKCVSGVGSSSAPAIHIAFACMCWHVAVWYKDKASKAHSTASNNQRTRTPTQPAACSTH